jgi:hypothetical protein
MISVVKGDAVEISPSLYSQASCWIHDSRLAGLMSRVSESLSGFSESLGDVRKFRVVKWDVVHSVGIILKRNLCFGFQRGHFSTIGLMYWEVINSWTLCF